MNFVVLNVKKLKLFMLFHTDTPPPTNLAMSARQREFWFWVLWTRLFVCLLTCCLFGFGFWVLFERRAFCVIQAMLELTMWTRLASNSQGSFFLCLHSVSAKGVTHRTKLNCMFNTILFYFFYFLNYNYIISPLHFFL